MDEHADRLFDARELRRAVRTLAEFVAADRAGPTPAVTDGLEIYSSACRLVNDRLGECHRLVKLGQRSEALRQVQMEPDALAMYNDLQFPNVKWLAGVCEETGLTPPPRLDATAAAKLNEAFAVEDTHKEVLRRHRLLALARAPLRRRLEVVRLIRKAAPHELCWQDDIGEYEATRVDEMRATMADPKARADWATVNDLYKEVTAADGWAVPFPPDLAEQIKQVRRRLLEEALRVALEPIRRRLDAPLRALAAATDAVAEPRSFADGQDAAEAFDRVEGAVERAVTEADAVRETYEVGAGSSLLAPFVDAADWLADGRKRRKEWREFETAVADLDAALENGVEWYYIQEYYRVASEYRLPLPSGVLARFRERAAGGGLLLYGGIAAGVAVLAAVLFFALR